jgi:phosphoribosylaminoimidazolecarboxamide formyltransferase/IMP cyclohydrolase
MTKKIKSALISVYYKDGLETLVALLHAHGVQIFSTGGTQKFIEDLGIPVTSVEDLTSYPSIFGGRVKTLHPKVFFIAETMKATYKLQLNLKFRQLI